MQGELRSEAAMTLGKTPEPPIWTEAQSRPHLGLSQRALVWARLGATPQGFDPEQSSDEELCHILETIAKELDSFIAALEGVDQIRTRLVDGWEVSKIRLNMVSDAMDCELTLGESSEIHELIGRGALFAGRMLAEGLPLPDSKLPPEKREGETGTDEVNDPEIVLRIGGADLSDAISGRVKIWSEGGMPGASVTLQSKVMNLALVDFLAEVQIMATMGGREQALFTGLVDRVSHNAETSELEFVSVGAPLTEMGMGGLGVGPGVDALELIWAIFRSSGMREDRIELESFNPGPLEEFDVVVPLDGIDLKHEMMIGEVFVSVDRSFKTLPKRLGPRELRKRFRSARVWAVARVKEKTLWEAEVEGSARVAAALSWMMASAHYSFNKDPYGGLAGFDRTWYRSRIHARDAIFVRGLTTGRTWLRAPTGVLYLPVAGSEAVGRFSPVESLSSLTPQFREALAAWRRAAVESDPIAAVSSLWEAVEFYVSGIKVPKVFDEKQLKQIRARAVQGLREDQASRVKRRIDEVNTPPLLERLRAALERDGVPFDDEDFAVLTRVRCSRNEFQHGRSREVPAEDDLRRALAFLNRAIVHRALHSRNEKPP